MQFPRRESHATDAATNPPQRLRHELHRPSVARPVDPSRRPRRQLQHAGILDRPRPHAGARQVRRAVPGRRPRHLRRLPRLPRHRAGAGRPGAGQRPADADLRHGRGDRAPRLRRHLRPVLRTALPVRPPHEHAGPPDQGPHRLEHRHRLPRQRRPRHGHGPAGRPRRPLRRRRGLHAGRPTNSGRQAGRMAPCCATARAAASPTPARSTASSTRAPTSRSTPSTCANPRRSAPRCCSRPAPPGAAAISPPATPSASSSTARRRRSSATSSATCAPAPPPPAATRTTWSSSP